MRAVNLIPAEARRTRGGAGGSGGLTVGSLGPSHFLVALLVVVVALITAVVLSENTVKDRRATLAAVNIQVATEQAQATKLQPFVAAVQAVQSRESAIETIAKTRFPWKTKFVELAHVLPSTTSLTTLSGTIAGAATSGMASSVASAGTPTFSLAGCADTKNQNGTATLLRRLDQLPGTTAVNFGSSTRQAGCGNNFTLTLNFEPIAGVSAAPGTTTAPATTGTTASTTTTPATTATSVTTTP